MVNSRAKGKRGELEFCKFLEEMFQIKARRSQQYCGHTGDAADIICDAGIHFEVKRVENLNINKALAQAVNDAKAKDLVPVVAHRKSRGEWTITIRAKDMVIFAREVLNALVKQAAI